MAEADPPDPTGLRAVIEKPAVRSIARRYFISNGFDGTLTAIGVVVGAFLSGIGDGLLVVKIGLGATIGLTTSAIWSVWEIERAETRLEILELERAMLTDLDDTRIQRQKSGARLVHAVASGAGPILGTILPLFPFLFEGSALSMGEATVAGVAVGVALLFSFGAYMGQLASQNWVTAGIRMGLAGLVVAGLNVLLPG